MARFTLRSRPTRRQAVRVMMNGRRSYDPDGRIVRYRWYTSGRREPICGRQRCWLTLRTTRRRKLKLVVTDGHGARASQRRTMPRARG